MSSNKTEHLGLHQWESADTFSRPEINENFQKVDAGVKALAAGAPRMAVGSYVGTGAYGAGSPNTLKFDFAPKLVLVMGFNHDNTSSQYPGAAILLNGVTKCPAVFARNPGGSDAGDSGTVVTTFAGNTVSFYSEYRYAQMNYAGLSYRYIAFG